MVEESVGSLGVCLTLEVTHMACLHVSSGRNEAGTAVTHCVCACYIFLHCIFAVEDKDYRVTNSTLKLSTSDSGCVTDDDGTVESDETFVVQFSSELGAGSRVWYDWQW